MPLDRKALDKPYIQGLTNFQFFKSQHASLIHNSEIKDKIWQYSHQYEQQNVLVGEDRSATFIAFENQAYGILKRVLE